jgi:hypothetical protein
VETDQAPSAFGTPSTVPYDFGTDPWQPLPRWQVLALLSAGFFRMHERVVQRGYQCCRFKEAHGRDAITAMAFDTSHRRLITGSDTGELKSWNFSSGSCLMEMVSSCSKDITGAPFRLAKP